MKIANVTMLMFVMITFYSCEKEAKLEEEISLKEFSALLDSDEFDYFNSLPIVDNRQLLSIFSEDSNDMSAKDSSQRINNKQMKGSAQYEMLSMKKWIEVKGKWHGSLNGSKGCNKPKGICAIIQIPWNGQVIDEIPIVEDHNVVAELFIKGDKALIDFQAHDQRISPMTSDDFVPIGSYIQLSENDIIKPGIYKSQDNKLLVDLISQ